MSLLKHNTVRLENVFCQSLAKEMLWSRFTTVFLQMYRSLVLFPNAYRIVTSLSNENQKQTTKVLAPKEFLGGVKSAVLSDLTARYAHLARRPLKSLFSRNSKRELVQQWRQLLTSDSAILTR